MTKKNQYIEIGIHLLFWLFIFTSVNVNWTSDWFDKSLRPKSPFPLIVLIFPIFCYANAFWLIPKYLNKKSWYKYLFFGFLLFIFPELIRSFWMSSANPTIDFWQELQSRDSFIFGSPSAFFLGINLSFGYRFTKDWFLNRNKIQTLNQKEAQRKTDELRKQKEADALEAERASKRQIPLIPEEEANQLLAKLGTIMASNKPYLNPEITLRDLANLTATSDKKLSYILNQKLDTKFYQYVNTFRIAAFKEQVADGASQHLSLVGIAKECGFKSKSSFYRSFKQQTGMAPSDYLKQIS